MNNLNTYIIEKLKITKDTKIDNNEKEINFIIKNLTDILEKEYTDNNFEIKYLKEEQFSNDKHGIKIQFKIRVLNKKLNILANYILSELKKLNENLKYYQIFTEYYNISNTKRYIIIFITDIEK